MDKKGDHSSSSSLSSSWEKYSRSNYNIKNHDDQTKWKRRFDQAGGILYQTSVLTPLELATIQTELDELSLPLKAETSSSVGRNRIGAALPPTSETVRIMRTGSPYQLAQKLLDSASNNMSVILATDVPVELRVYEKMGAGMEWHVDDVLYDPSQTLENTLDCATQWKSKQGVITSRETDANSILLLRAGGVEHSVSSLHFERRVILKCAYIIVNEGSTLLPSSNRDSGGINNNVLKNQFWFIKKR